MGAAATVWVDILVRNNEVQAALENTRMGMEAVHSLAAETSNATAGMLAMAGWKDEAAKVDDYGNAVTKTGEQTETLNGRTNNLGGGLFRLNAITMLLGRQMGMTAGQLQALNMAMLALGGRANLLSSGGMAKLSATLSAIPGVGWAAIAVLTAFGASFAYSSYEAKKAAEGLKEYNDFFEKFTAAMKGADEAMYGGESPKVVALRATIDSLTEVEKKYGTIVDNIREYQRQAASGRVAKPELLTAMAEEEKDKLPAGHADEIIKDVDAAREKKKTEAELIPIYQELATAQQEITLKVLEHEITTTAAYKKSNDFLRDKIGLNTDYVAAINNAQAAIVNLGGKEKANRTEYLDLEERKLNLQKQNAALFDEIADKKQKAFEESIKPEIERQQTVEDLINSLNDEIATLGMTSDALEIYRLMQKGAGDADLDRAEALLKVKKARQDGLDADKEAMEYGEKLADATQRTLDENMTDQEKYQKRLKEIDEQQAVFGTPENADKFARAKAKALDDLIGKAQKFQSIFMSGDDLWERIQTGLASSVGAAGASAGAVSSSQTSRALTPADTNTGEISGKTQTVIDVLNKMLTAIQNIKLGYA